MSSSSNTNAITNAGGKSPLNATPGNHPVPELTLNNISKRYQEIYNYTGGPVSPRKYLTRLIRYLTCTDMADPEKWRVLFDKTTVDQSEHWNNTFVLRYFNVEEQAIKSFQEYMLKQPALFPVALQPDTEAFLESYLEYLTKAFQRIRFLLRVSADASKRHDKPLPQYIRDLALPEIRKDQEFWQQKLTLKSTYQNICPNALLREMDASEKHTVVTDKPFFGRDTLVNPQFEKSETSSSKKKIANPTKGKVGTVHKHQFAKASATDNTNEGKHNESSKAKVCIPEPVLKSVPRLPSSRQPFRRQLNSRFRNVDISGTSSEIGTQSAIPQDTPSENIVPSLTSGSYVKSLQDDLIRSKTEYEKCKGRVEEMQRELDIHRKEHEKWERLRNNHRVIQEKFQTLVKQLNNNRSISSALFIHIKQLVIKWLPDSRTDEFEKEALEGIDKIRQTYARSAYL